MVLRHDKRLDVVIMLGCFTVSHVTLQQEREQDKARVRERERESEGVTRFNSRSRDLL